MLITTMTKPFVLSLCLLLFTSTCLARSNWPDRFSQCQLDRINALEPDNRVESEAGLTETWSPRQSPELQCAGVSVIRRTIEPKGLHLPSFTPSPQLILIVQGRGALGIAIPGCPETYEESRSSQGRRRESSRSRSSQQQEQQRDSHQKIRHFRSGDVIAIPAGVPYWSYNYGNEPVVAISLIDTSNFANQLDQTPRVFYLAGKPGLEHPETEQSSQSQRQPRRETPGGRRQGQHQQQQGDERREEEDESGSVLSGFGTEFLQQAFNTDRDTARQLQSPEDERRQIVRVENDDLSFISPESDEDDDEDQDEDEDEQQQHGRGHQSRRQFGRRTRRHSREDEDEDEDEDQDEGRQGHGGRGGRGRRGQREEEEDEDEERQEGRGRGRGRGGRGRGQREEEEDEDEERQGGRGRGRGQGQREEEEDEDEERQGGRGRGGRGGRQHRKEEEEDEDEEREGGRGRGGRGRRQTRQRHFEREEEEEREGGPGRRHREHEHEEEEEEEESHSTVPWRRESRGRRGCGTQNGLEENLCTLKIHENINRPSRADLYNPRAGRISDVNGLTLPILNFLGLSAEYVNLYQNGIYTPHWNLNANSIMYVVRGRGRVRIVNCQGKAVFNDELRRGQLLVVPQNFVVAQQAQDEGFEYVVFKTNARAAVSNVKQVFRATPAEVLANAFGLRQRDVSDLKFNGNWGPLVNPDNAQSRSRDNVLAAKAVA